MEERSLKDYKGFQILKTWDLEMNGYERFVQANVLYMAYDKDDNIFDSAKTLKELKKKIDNYVA